MIKLHPGWLGYGFHFWGEEKVPGTENPNSTATARHRQSGAPLLATLKESGSGDGTGGLWPDGGAQKASVEMDSPVREWGKGPGSLSTDVMS